MEKKSKNPETLEKKFNIVIAFAWVTLFYKSTTGNTVISYQHRVFCLAVYCLKELASLNIIFRSLLITAFEDMGYMP